MAVLSHHRGKPVSAREFHRLVESIFSRDSPLLEGLRVTSPTSSLLSAIVAWSGALDRELEEVVGAVEPCLRQSVLMSLLPAKAFDPSYADSYDKAIKEHLAALRVPETPELVARLRTLCINVIRLRGLSRDEARRQSMSMKALRADPDKHNEILSRQSERCYWCGVSLTATGVRQSLDHLVPKHLGDDPSDGSNWAITCTACNSGKEDVFVWAASAAAFDYVDRNDFGEVDLIGLKPRWCVLARDRVCRFCKHGPNKVELWAYRRVRTGLAIPSNCSTACSPCGRVRAVDFLRPRWPELESERAYA